MSKEEILDKIADLSYRMNWLVHDMYEAGYTDDDIQCAVDDGAREYRIMLGDEE